MTLCDVEPVMMEKQIRRAGEGKATPRQRAGAAVRRMSWAYFLVLIAIWLFIRLAGDRLWLATIMLFGPVWVTLLPLIVLVPGAIIFRPRAFPILLAGAGVALFLLMGVCIPWRLALQSHGAVHGQPLRVLTCNVHGKSALNKLINGNYPDIVMLQEWPGTKEKPLPGFGKWQIRQDGELLVASRYPILKTEVFTDSTWSNWGGSAARYDIAAPGGTIHLFNIHLASPHRPFDAVMAGKPAATDRLEQYLQVRTAQSRLLSQIAAMAGPDVILGGDFNTPCEGQVYHHYWRGFVDAFTTAGFGLGHTYFAHGAAVRIDHVLSGAGWECKKCMVGAYIGSPHRPVIAELVRIKAN